MSSCDLTVYTNPPKCKGLLTTLIYIVKSVTRFKCRCRSHGEWNVDESVREVLLLRQTQENASVSL